MGNALLAFRVPWIGLRPRVIHTSPSLASDVPDRDVVIGLTGFVKKSSNWRSD